MTHLERIQQKIKKVQQQLSDWYSEYEYMNSHQSSDLSWNQIETDMIDERIELENQLNYLSEKKQQMFDLEQKEKELVAA